MNTVNPFNSVQVHIIIIMIIIWYIICKRGKRIELNYNQLSIHLYKTNEHFLHWVHAMAKWKISWSWIKFSSQWNFRSREEQIEHWLEKIWITNVILSVLYWYEIENKISHAMNAHARNDASLLRWNTRLLLFVLKILLVYTTTAAQWAPHQRKVASSN